MKIAVMSDIHGNLLALESVLEDAEKERCEKFLFLGDYALAGPEPDDTVNFCMSLFNRDNVEMIQGNTDKMIAEYSEELYSTLSKAAPVMANALREEANNLSKNQIEFLKNLPKKKDIEIDNIKILMVHGSPRKNNEDILPTTSIEEVEEMIKDSKADLILCGHTHLPCGFQTNTKQTVVNDGSVGRPFTENPESCYVIITTTGNGNFEIEHKFVKYNNIQAAKKLAQRGFEGAEKLANNLIHSTARHF